MIRSGTDPRHGDPLALKSRNLFRKRRIGARPMLCQMIRCICLRKAC
jgi:hypothetical protein